MADSTTNLDTITSGQSSKEVTANDLYDAGSPATLLGRRASTTAGLTWGYYGGVAVLDDGTSLQIANGTKTLTNNATNYLELDTSDGSVDLNTTSWTADKRRLYEIVVASGAVTGYTDWRSVMSSSAASVAADDVSITDAGTYFTGTDVEAALQEIGAALGSVGTGDVVGPGSSTNNHVAVFSGTTGKVIADSGLGLGTAATLDFDTDTALAANSDARLATQKAVKAYVDAIVTGGASDVMIFKGLINASTNPNYPAADAGNLYKISVAGKIGGASGANVEVGDTIYCIVDGSAAGTQAAVGANWVISQVNVDGAVVGPAAATDGHVALFDGATGKLIKDSGLTLSGANTGDQTSVSGNAGTATALQTARTIGGVSFDGTADITQPFDMGGFYPGIPTASAKVLRVPIARAVTFPANFAGSYFSASANATGTTVFDVQKNGSSIGSVSIAAGGTTATFTTTSGTSKAFAAGDVLSIIAPASADATLADPGFCFAGTR